jgi:hypothetical protein
MINPQGSAISYAAETKLLDLIEIACTTSKKQRREDNFEQAAKIFYFLDALSFIGYLDDDQVNNIYECLKVVSEIYDFPVSPVNGELEPPTINTGPVGPKGDTGSPGRDGGATDFLAVNVITNTVVDSFEISEAVAVRWDYVINGTAQRAGSIIATWTEDGTFIDNWGDLGTEDINGSTEDVQFTTTVVGTEVRLNAIVASGTWTITGSRYFIPNNGKGLGPITNALPEGQVYIGDSNNQATAQSITGDISITPGGVASIEAGVIFNNDINATAAIATTKLAALTASRAVVTNGSGFLATSAATSTEVGYLSGVTSNIQVQLDSKLSGATGAISTVVSLDLTPSRVVVSDPAGKIAITGVTTTEVGYVAGVTSAIQTQLDSRVVVVGGTLNVKKIDIGDWNMNTTTSVVIPHGVTSGISKIHNVSAKIINDISSVVTNFLSYNGYGAITWNDTNITLTINPGSPLFDNTSYEDTPFNRGVILIEYES